MSKINRESVNTIHPKTVWLYIKDDIEMQIINGILKSGDKVSSISEIATMYSVSSTTAQKVLEDMFLEGTVNKRKGIGYFVVPYQKERLKNKHRQELFSILENFFNYAKRLSLDEKDINNLKTLFLKKLSQLSELGE